MNPIDDLVIEMGTRSNRRKNLLITYYQNENE